MKDALTIRRAAPEDLDLLYELIGEFAVYEHNEKMFTATKEMLRESLFEKEYGETFFLEDGDGVQGLMILTRYFVPYIAKNTLLLELLYIRESARGRGYGHEVFRFLARYCEENDMPRLEWFCLRDNEIGNKFYHAMGFAPSERLLFYRAGDARLQELREE